MRCMKYKEENALNCDAMNHLKIWFAMIGTHPLGGIINELRLISQSKIYQDRNEKLTLLTHFNNKNDIEYVQSFCNKYGIDLVTTSDIEYELNNRTWIDKSIQLSLFEICMAELTHPAGKPVIASDIFRLLSPVLQLGAYSDIDVKVNLGNSLKNLATKDLPELLFNLTAYHFSSNFLYAKNVEHQLLVDFRKYVYSKYLDITSLCNINLNYFSVTLHGKAMLVEENATAEYKQFANQHFAAKTVVTINDILDFRQKVKASLTKHHDPFFYFYVMSLAGPLSFLNYFGECKLMNLTTELPKYSITKTPLNLADENINKSSDLSWMEVGINRKKDENETIHQSALMIQRFWRKKIKKYDVNEIRDVKNQVTSLNNRLESIGTHSVPSNAENGETTLINTPALITAHSDSANSMFNPKKRSCTNPSPLKKERCCKHPLK